jgi:hypothetical protein
MVPIADRVKGAPDAGVRLEQPGRSGGKGTVQKILPQTSGNPRAIESFQPHTGFYLSVPLPLFSRKQYLSVIIPPRSVLYIQARIENKKV